MIEKQAVPVSMDDGDDIRGTKRPFDDSNTISTLVVLRDGCLSSALVSMDNQWSAHGWLMTKRDDDCGHEESLGRLAMSCAFSSGSDVIYIFGSSTRNPEAVATDLPSQVEDLLIFCPLVPMRKTKCGFQGLTAQEWSTLIVPAAIPEQPTITSSFTNRGDGDDDMFGDEDQQSLGSGCLVDDESVDESLDDEIVAIAAPTVEEEDLYDEDDSENEEDGGDDVFSVSGCEDD